MKVEHIKQQYNWLIVKNGLVKIDEGWVWLLSGLCQSLEVYENLSEKPERLQITGVRQRLGALSITYTGEDSNTAAMIRAVELASNRVCQECGATDEVGGTFGPAIYTLCRYCWKHDEKYHGHLFNPSFFVESDAAIIEAGLLPMPDGWFKIRLQKMVCYSQ